MRLIAPEQDWVLLHSNAYVQLAARLGPKLGYRASEAPTHLSTRLSPSITAMACLMKTPAEATVLLAFQQPNSAYKNKAP